MRFEISPMNRSIRRAASFYVEYTDRTNSVVSKSSISYSTQDPILLLLLIFHYPTPHRSFMARSTAHLISHRQSPLL